MTKVITPEGYQLERPPLSPLEAAVAKAGLTPEPGAAASKDDDDEDLDGEEAREKELRTEWKERWSRLTLSSGSGVPPFPGVEKAERFLRPS